MYFNFRMTKYSVLSSFAITTAVVKLYELHKSVYNLIMFSRMMQICCPSLEA